MLFSVLESKSVELFLFFKAFYSFEIDASFSPAHPGEQGRSP